MRGSYALDKRDYIKKGFEAYYRRYDQVTEYGFGRWMGPDVPGEMKATDSNEEWSIWRLVPSTVTDGDICALEKEFGLDFPEWYQAFISTYHHYFDIVPAQPVDEPLRSIQDMYNPLLCKWGYLPFAWDSEYGHILCMDLTGPDEEHYAIYEIDHEILFDFDEEKTGRDQLKASMRFLYPNFKSFFDDAFELK
ncbi:conserved protein of unknown function [Paenibacillus alvei]|uniref:Knr4/Smi1-like domain-containing protein n=1 Tax=Paenibacillus alvei TaxID=44250 RepID=A0A383RAV0_PAEAL|nr:conserved protein of unknown function [Paenibacillus alvei]